MPVQRQVDGHAPALAAQLDDVPPQVAAGAGTVGEQCRSARAAPRRPNWLDRTGWYQAAVLVETFHFADHRFLPHVPPPGVPWRKDRLLV